MSSESFKNYCQGIQALFIAVGLVGSAIWASLTFFLLKENETAQLENERTRIAIELQKSDMNLSPELSIETVGYNSSHQRIFFNIKIKNNYKECSLYKNLPKLEYKFLGDNADPNDLESYTPADYTAYAGSDYNLHPGQELIIPAFTKKRVA